MRLLIPRNLFAETEDRILNGKLEYHILWKRWLLSTRKRFVVSWTPNQPHVIRGVDGLSGNIQSFTIDQRNGDVIFDTGYRGCANNGLGRLRDGNVEWISTEWVNPSFASLSARNYGFSDLCISKTGVIYAADTHNHRVCCIASDPQSSYSIKCEETLLVRCIGCMYIINLESGEFTALIERNSRYDDRDFAQTPSFDSEWFERDAKERGAKSILWTALNKYTCVIPLSDTKLLFVGHGPVHVHDLNTNELIVLNDTEPPKSSYDKWEEWKCAAIDPTNNRDLYLASYYGDICVLPKFLPL